MAERVLEIMNRELFSVAPDERVGRVLGYFRALGITSAPVVDDDRRAIGFISLRDLVGAPAEMHIHVRMSAPAAAVAASAPIDEAARAMARTGRHHLVCLDSDGRAIGFVGSLDVVRGLVGEPVSHPAAFPHYDPTTGLTWTDDVELSYDGVQIAPDGPGLFALVAVTPGRPNRIAWSEASSNVRTRLSSLLAGPLDAAPPHVCELLAHERLWFRAAAAPGLRALPGEGSAA
jgi:CBS domain-containing protein